MLLNQVFFSFRETCLFTVAGGGRKNKKPKPPLMCFTHVHISVCLFTADIDGYCYKSGALKSHRVATYGRRGRLWTSHRPVSPFKKEQVYIQVLWNSLIKWTTTLSKKWFDKFFTCIYIFSLTKLTCECWMNRHPSTDWDRNKIHVE